MLHSFALGRLNHRLLRHPYAILKAKCVIYEKRSTRILQVNMCWSCTTLCGIEVRNVYLTQSQTIWTPQLSRKTQDPQRVDSSRADAEWKIDPGLANLTHGTEGMISIPKFHSSSYIPILKRFEAYGRAQSEEVDRSYKASSKPDIEMDNKDVIRGEGSRGIKGWTGDGKGGLGHNLERNKDPLTERH